MPPLWLICTVSTLVWRKTAPCLLQVWKLLPLYIRVEYKLCDSFNWESMVVVRFFYHVIRCIQLRLFLNFLRQCNLKILLRPWVVEVCGVCLKLSDWVERKIKRSVERWTVEKWRSWQWTFVGFVSCSVWSRFSKMWVLFCILATNKICFVWAHFERLRPVII